MSVFRREVLPLIAPGLREIFSRMPAGVESSLEEIRVRAGKPVYLYCGRKELMLGEAGIAPSPDRAYRPTMEHLRQTLQLISRCSLYAFEEELRRGYITIPGGHRVGLCGRAVLEKGSVKLQKDISGLNIRLARQVAGAADAVLPLLVQEGHVCSTLVISPPQGGKTTLLRDLARQLGDGGYKVSVVDERSEIGGAYGGVPQLDIGLRTDLLDACPKAEGMMLVVRSMSPQVVITDEIGRPEDVSAVMEVANAGVSLIASAHGRTLQELRLRPSLKEILDLGVFERIVVLSRRRGPGTIEQVTNTRGGGLLAAR